MADQNERHERKRRDFRDEMYLPGGVYFEGRDGDDRTDISINEVGEDGNDDNPRSFNVNITSGNCTYAWVGILPEDLARVGRFLVEQSGE